jgi:hypothetical protein
VALPSSAKEVLRMDDSGITRATSTSSRTPIGVKVSGGHIPSSGKEPTQPVLGHAMCSNMTAVAEAAPRQEPSTLAGTPERKQKRTALCKVVERKIFYAWRATTSRDTTAPRERSEAPMPSAPRAPRSEHAAGGQNSGSSASLATAARQAPLPESAATGTSRTTRRALPGWRCMGPHGCGTTNPWSMWSCRGCGSTLQIALPSPHRAPLTELATGGTNLGSPSGSVTAARHAPRSEPVVTGAARTQASAML